jgi:hypothetical protein
MQSSSQPDSLICRREVRGRSASARLAAVTEYQDSQTNLYSVEFDGHRYPVHGPNLAVDHAWGLAAYALFDIINRQLAPADIRLYTINGGNDLFGIFMTPEQADRARTVLTRKSDWPYLPASEPPWFGMFHDG